MKTTHEVHALELRIETNMYNYCSFFLFFPFFNRYFSKQ